MGYSKSKRRVLEVLPYLKDLIAYTDKHWPSDEPKKLAQKLYEAFHAAKHHEKFKAFAELKENYILHPKSTWLEAEYIGTPGDGTSGELNLQPTLPAATVIEEVKSPDGAVGACIKFAQKTMELKFPNFVPSEEEKRLLYKWGRKPKAGPSWRLIDHGEKGVTLTQRKNLNEAFFWKPRDWKGI